METQEMVMEKSLKNSLSSLGTLPQFVDYILACCKFRHFIDTVRTMPMQKHTFNRFLFLIFKRKGGGGPFTR